MGFLDNQERIIDMVLTDEGKKQLSRGELRFVYYSFFDDGVDYDPVIASSSSMSEADLSASRTVQTEAFLGLEAAPTCYRNVSEGFGASRKLFTMPQGQKILPRASFDPATFSGSIQVDRSKLETAFVGTSRTDRVDGGFSRIRSSKFVVDVGVEDFFPEFMQDGFALQVFLSGSDGLVQLDLKRDDLERDSFGAELIVDVDQRDKK